MFSKVRFLKIDSTNNIIINMRFKKLKILNMKDM